MLAPLLVFPINNLFPHNWNKPTFASSCSKLLLNSRVTLSNETVRGNMKFSNSSSSSPTGKETKTAKASHNMEACLAGSVSSAFIERSHWHNQNFHITYRNKNLRFDIFLLSYKQRQIVDRKQLVSETGTSLLFTSVSFSYFCFLC